MAKRKSLDDKIDEAIVHRNRAIANDEKYAMNYWSGYIEALREIKKEDEKKADK